MAHTLQAKLKEPEADENKRGPKPQDLIRLYDIILQVNVWTSNVLYVVILNCRVFLFFIYREVVWIKMLPSSSYVKM